MKRFVYLVSAITCVVSGPATAQWAAAPTQPTDDTLVAPVRTSPQSVSNCRIFLPAPFDTREYFYIGVCVDGLGNGYQKTKAFAPKGGQVVSVETTFIRGYPTGKITISDDIDFALAGDILADGSISGISSGKNGMLQAGIFRNGVFTDGLVQKLNQPTEFVVDGRAASEAEYRAKQTVTESVSPLENRTANGEPPCYLEQPFIKQGNTLTGQYAGRCINDRYNGKAVLSLIDQSNKWGDSIVFTVNYKDGQPFGTAMIDSGNGAMIFTGTLKNWKPWNGYTEAFDENNRPVRFGTRNGQDAPYAQIGRIPVFTAYDPPAQLASAQKPNRGACDADRPTNRYFVTGEYPGECRGGRYTGTAELTLTPKDASQPTIKIKAPFQNGYLSGPVVAKYPQLGITYKGTFDGWRPQDGVSEQPTGDRNYLIKEYRSGIEISSRSEYRPPSELEVALIGAAGQIGQNLGARLGQEIDGTASRQRQQKREAEAYQARQQDIARANEITRQAQATAGQQVYAEQSAQEHARQQAQADWQRQSDATIADARRKALAGLDRDGNPLPAPSDGVARNGPSAPPIVTTNPPVFGGTTSAPVFGGNANRQGDPPVIAPASPALPAPHPADQRLPDLVRGVEPLAPPVPAPVQVASLPDPVTPQPNGVPPPLGTATSLPRSSNSPTPLAPPVQLGNGSDILRTGSVPSNPVPQQPSQAASSGPSRSPVKPETPSNPRTNAAASPRITMQWNLVQGATYYEFGLRDLGSGQLLINQQVSGSGVTTDLAPGGNYRWNVAACNSAGCSTYSSPQQFSIAGNSPNQQSTFGFTAEDNRWRQTLPIELQVQVLRLTGAQVQAYKDRGDWSRFKQVVTQAAGEMRNAEIEEQREKLAIWERAWSQSQRVLIEGSLWLVPVERIAAAAYDMSKVVRGARIVVETPRGVGATGIIGEKFLQTLGGRSQVGFQTTRGMRYVDQVVGRVGHESKVGYQSLSGDIPEQIAKDQLLLVRDLDIITWHFFRSPTTGKIGPSGPLREALRKAGIQIIEHPNP